MVDKIICGNTRFFSPAFILKAPNVEHVIIVKRSVVGLTKLILLHVATQAAVVRVRAPHLVVEVQLLHLRADTVILVQETAPITDHLGPGGPTQVRAHLDNRNRFFFFQF